MSERDRYLLQVEKLENSHVLHASESLRRLLRYLARHALDHPGIPLKEYQIATEELGRPSDFDPAVDSMVRVQAGRLRAKLAEYYATEGVEDSIRIDLPKGSYALSFHPHRHPAPSQPPSPEYLSPGSRPSAPTRVSRVWPLAVVTLSVLLIAALAVVFLTRRDAPVAIAKAENPSSPALQQFWKPFLRSPDEPCVVFSNAVFIGRPETGMRYFNSSRDSRGAVFDHYTGVGEVLAIHELDLVFSAFHRKLRVKRGSLFSIDDAKNNDLIFVGSPSENLTLREISGTHEFVFYRLDSGPRKGDLVVMNVHPQQGEPKFYLASLATAPLTDDYAVIALVPGLNPSRSVMITAGITTLGTLGAVDFVTGEESIKQLLPRLSPDPSAGWQPFEALLHVKVAKGVPFESELVSLRKLPAP